MNFAEQIVPGTFEYALNWLLDHEIDLTVFDVRYCTDEVGAAAYHPGVLLKIVLFGYARGLTSSRDIERACRENGVEPVRAKAGCSTAVGSVSWSRSLATCTPKG